MLFEFGPAKSASNPDKHGVDFVEAQKAFDDSRLVSLRARDSGEARRMAIAMTGDLHRAVIYTLRDDIVRIISVRRARRDENAGYDGR